MRRELLPRVRVRVQEFPARVAPLPGCLLLLLQPVALATQPFKTTFFYLLAMPEIGKPTTTCPAKGHRNER